MEKLSLLPGFRFDPTDVQLVMYYLKRKVMGRQFPYDAISEIELYNFEPWDLRDESCLKSKDLVWFFFCSPNRKYAIGSRKNRTTNNGFWKTTGKDKPICYDSRTVGMRKTLIFHRGKSPHGARTNWVMHEYRLEDKEVADASISQDAFVLCKIFEKSGRGPKNGEQYGAPFKEEDWDDDDDDDDCEGNDSLMPLPLTVPSSHSPGPEDGQNAMMILNALESGNGCDSVSELLPEQSETTAFTEQHCSCSDHDDIDKLLASVSDEHADFSLGSGNGERVESVVPNKSTAENADGEIFEGLEDITGNVDLNSIDKLKSHKHLEEEHQMEVEGSYLELNDLRYPMEADGSDYRTSDCLFTRNAATALPAPEAMYGFQGNWECQEPTYLSASHSSLTAGEIGGIHAPQSLARGSFRDPQCQWWSQEFDARGANINDPPSE